MRKRNNLQDGCFALDVKVVKDTSWGVVLHCCEACPCYADLRDPQQSCEAPESAELLAAGKIGAAGGKDEDVGEGARGRDSA